MDEILSWPSESSGFCGGDTRDITKMWDKCQEWALHPAGLRALKGRDPNETIPADDVACVAVAKESRVARW